MEARVREQAERGKKSGEKESEEVGGAKKSELRGEKKGIREG